MSNLINRTELFNELSRVPISQYAVDERTQIYNVINEMPTAETTGDLDDAIQEYIKSGLMELDNLRPKGHWITRHVETAPKFVVERFYCSECGNWQIYGMPHYCPNCGADMRGESE